MTRLPAADGDAPKGAVYYLPRTDVKLSLKLSVHLAPSQQCESSADGCRMTLVEKSPLTVSDIALETATRPDPKAGFVLQTAASVVTKTSFKGELSERFGLIGATATAESKAAELVAAGLEVVGVVAKVIAKLRADGDDAVGDPVIHAKVARRAAVKEALAALDKQLRFHADALQKASKPKDIEDAAKALGAMLETNQERTAQLTAELEKLRAELDETIELDVKCFIADVPGKKVTQSITADTCPALASVFGALCDAGVVPEQKDKTCPAALAGHMGEMVVAWEAGEAGERWDIARGATVKGFVYRVPEWRDVTVSLGSRAVARAVLPFAGQARFAVLAFEDTDLDGDSTLAVTLHETTGGLKTFEHRRGPVEAEHLTTLGGALSDLVDSRQDAELQALRREVEVRELKTKLVDADEDERD